MARPAVFLDRDGTIIIDRINLTDPLEVELLPGAAEAVRRLNDAGLFTVMVTNQGVVARGWATEAEVEASNARANELLHEVAGAHLDAMYYCPHHPDFTGECDCRKPAPGMLIQAAREHDLDLERSYMVGDWWSDVGAGIGAGTGTVLITGTGGDNARAEEGLQARGWVPDARARDLAEAVDRILGDLEEQR